MTITPTAVEVSLLATDWANSVTRRVSDGAQIACNYTAYGHLAQGAGAESDSGFNGQRREPSGMYLLGNGYRAYLPSLGRFNAPDNLSPFATGGLNSYTYCRGEPVNRSDPSGHGDNAWSYAMIGLGLLAVAGGIAIAAKMPKLLGLGIGTAAGGTLAAGTAAFGLGPIDKDFSRDINIAAAVLLVAGVAGGALVNSRLSRSYSTLPEVHKLQWRNPMALSEPTNPFGPSVLSRRSSAPAVLTTRPHGSGNGNVQAAMGNNAPTVGARTRTPSPTASSRSNRSPSPPVTVQGAPASTVQDTVAPGRLTPAGKKPFESSLYKNSDYNAMALTPAFLKSKGVRT